jgi:endonuclease/exonuclease/phosphatase family metal-dependent hydrolase
LASFNIQVGIGTSSYGEYFTGGWRHVLPSTKRIGNLGRIAALLAPFDIVGLQEVDGGGSRSHYIVQTEYLAHHGGFDYWHHQINRRLGNVALHSNGLLSRLRPSSVQDYTLPGLPGRGIMLARFGPEPKSALHLCVAHLALSRRARLRQLAFVGEVIQDLPYAVLMGDLNCGPHSPEMKFLTRTTRLCDPQREVMTFPSWRPRVMLDHILVTPRLRVENLKALNFACSDHLPISMEIALPEDLRVTA